MAPQQKIPLSANILGTIGTAVGAFKIWYNWRQKKTEGLPGIMVFLWAICVAPLGVYAIVQKFSIALQIQPQIFCALSLISWAQTIVYHDHWKTWKATVLVVCTGAVIAGTQVLLVMTLRGPYLRGITWPITMVGVIAAVMLAAGLIPPYFEIWKRRGRVVGISFVFLAVDWLGALFSLFALVAQQTFDALGGASYIACLVLEAGIVTSHWIWLVRTRKVRKEAMLAGKSIDDLNSKTDDFGNKQQFDGPRERWKIISASDLELGSISSKPAAPSTSVIDAVNLSLPEIVHYKD